jgi:hypothetical protein
MDIRWPNLARPLRTGCSSLTPLDLIPAAGLAVKLFRMRK